MCNESSDSNSEDFNDRCGVCKSKDPLLHESKAPHIKSNPGLTEINCAN